jgi:hypothetical protein
MSETAPALVCTAKDNAALADALGQDPHVVVLPRTRIYRKAVDAVAFYHDLITARVSAGGPRCAWSARSASTPDPKAMTNGAGTRRSATTPWRRCHCGACAYDTQFLRRPLLDTAWVTHPWLRAGGERARNGDFVEPARLLIGLVRPLEPPATEAVALTLTRPVLTGLRRWLRAGLDAAQVRTEAAENAVLAVDEVAASGLRHGWPPVEVALWLPRHPSCATSPTAASASPTPSPATPHPTPYSCSRAAPDCR